MIYRKCYVSVVQIWACLELNMSKCQDSCACTRILWIYLYIYYTRIIICLAPKQPLYDYNNLFCFKTAPEQTWKCLRTSVLHSRLRRIQWRIVICLARNYLFATLSLLSSKQAHICTTETLHFPEIIDFLKDWKSAVEIIYDPPGKLIVWSLQTIWRH